MGTATPVLAAQHTHAAVQANTTVAVCAVAAARNTLQKQTPFTICLPYENAGMSEHVLQMCCCSLCWQLLAHQPEQAPASCSPLQTLHKTIVRNLGSTHALVSSKQRMLLMQHPHPQAVLIKQQPSIQQQEASSLSQQVQCCHHDGG